MKQKCNSQSLEQYNPYREEHEAGPFTNNPKIQPHEESAVEADRQSAAMLGFSERDTDAFVKNRLMLRRQAAHIRRQEQLKIGENVSIILNPALKREYERQQAQSVGQNEKPRGSNPKLDARNDWFIECRLQGQTWQQICDAQHKVCHENGWPKVAGPDAVHKAAKARSQNTGLTLPKGKGGRPKSSM